MEKSHRRGRGRDRRRIAVRNVIIASVLLAALAGCAWHALAGQTGTHTIVLTGFVEGQERIVRSEVAGRVLDVQVREGDTVDPGRLLVRIDQSDAASRRRQQELATRYAAAPVSFCSPPSCSC